MVYNVYKASSNNTILPTTYALKRLPAKFAKLEGRDQASERGSSSTFLPLLPLTKSEFLTTSSISLTFVLMFAR